MFPSDQQRYDRYWTWCVILGVRPASQEKWKELEAKVPEHLPISWRTSGEQYA